jgi:hypothetical protein
LALRRRTSAAIAGITTSPQLRESPETVNCHVPGADCAWEILVAKAAQSKHPTQMASATQDDLSPFFIPRKPFRNPRQRIYRDSC